MISVIPEHPRRPYVLLRTMASPICQGTWLFSRLSVHFLLTVTSVDVVCTWGPSALVCVSCDESIPS